MEDKDELFKDEVMSIEQNEDSINVNVSDENTFNSKEENVIIKNDFFDIEINENFIHVKSEAIKISNFVKDIVKEFDNISLHKQYYNDMFILYGALILKLYSELDIDLYKISEFKSNELILIEYVNVSLKSETLQFLFATNTNVYFIINGMKIKRIHKNDATFRMLTVDEKFN